MLQPEKCQTCGVTAESASVKLDANGIIAECDKILESVETLNDIKENINAEASEISPKILCVDGQGIGDNVTNCISDIQKYINEIKSRVESIKSTTVKEYDKIQKYNNEHIDHNKKRHEKK